MGLLNYTTKIDADKTASEIQKCLTSHGVQAVMTEYDPETNSLVAISFKLTVKDQTMGFKLPCDWRPVATLIDSTIPKVRRSWDKDAQEERQSRVREQAVRVAWRIVKDWVEAQMALVETRMVTTQQVFLPYAVMKDGRTLSEHVSENPKFLLDSGK